MGNERGIRSNNDDDRTPVILCECRRAVSGAFWNFSTYGRSSNTQVRAPAVIALHQDSHRVSARFSVESA